MPIVTDRNPLALAKRFALRVMRPPFPSVAEAKDVKFLSVAEEKSAAGRILRLEGLVFHSALAVRSIGIEKKGDAIVVEVALTPAGRGRSGRFATEIPLPIDTHRVLFGRELVPIWQDMKEESQAREQPG